MLEANALEVSIQRMTECTFQRAEEYCDESARETYVARWAELNRQLYSCLYEDADKPILHNLIRSMNDRIERYLRIQLSLSCGSGVDDRENPQILAACRDRDVALATICSSLRSRRLASPW